MQLYFSPLACSMATRIALYETDQPAELVEVDPATKRTRDGADYRAIHPLALVPALRLDDDTLLTENAAILQYVADRAPAAELAPRDPAGRTALHQWLCFIGTELHKLVFAPLLDRQAPDAVKAYAVDKAEARLAYVAAHLANRAYLLERYSVADAYLFTVLSWSPVTPIQLARWPALTAYLARLRLREAVARAVTEERALYLRERAGNR